MEHPSGGLRGRPGDEPYPEVTGYMIPTLRKWGEHEFAARLTAWLASVQQPNGGFKGWKSKSELTFDTAMTLEAFAQANMYGEYDRASEFCRRNINHQHGFLELSDLDKATRIYTVKAGAEIGFNSPYWRELMQESWPCGDEGRERIHHIAYGLEGAWALGWNVDHLYDILRGLDKPYSFWYTRRWEPYGLFCPVGNLQMSILLDDEELFRSVRLDDLLWTMRYYLEAAWHFEQK